MKTQAQRKMLKCAAYQVQIEVRGVCVVGVAGVLDEHGLKRAGIIGEG